MAHSTTGELTYRVKEGKKILFTCQLINIRLPKTIEENGNNYNLSKTSNTSGWYAYQIWYKRKKKIVYFMKDGKFHLYNKN